MDNKALFVGFEPAPGKSADVADFLRGALGPVEEEPDTRDWYAIRFSASEFSVFDTFPGNAGRLKHLFGEVGRELIVKTFTILDGLPDIRPAEVLAAKPLAKGLKPALCLHLPLKAREGQGEAVAEFLTNARELAGAEVDTLAWYAFRLGADSFAILDFFADEAARAAHRTGKLAEALLRQSELFAHPPETCRGEVLACKAGLEGAAGSA